MNVKMAMLASFPFFAYQAPCLESGNIVGYTSENVTGQGMAVNRYQRPMGGQPELSELMPEAPIGTELAFFDGVEWVTAVADEDDNGVVHWFDKRDNNLADTYKVPVGAGVKYKLPEGEQGRFMSVGEVSESYMSDAAAVFDGGISLDEVRLPKDKADVILRPQIVVTNNVVVTNHPPNRFAVRLKSGELHHAMWMADTLAICNPITGLELRIPVSSVTRFEVDDAAPEKLRMGKAAVAKVEEFYLAEVIKERKRLEAARQEETEKGIAKSVKEEILATILDFPALVCAIIGMIVSAVIAYHVGKWLDKVYKWLYEFWSWLNKLVRPAAPTQPIEKRIVEKPTSPRKPKKRNGRKRR